MLAAWDAAHAFIVGNVWIAAVVLLGFFCAALASYAREQVRAGLNWALAPITLSFPWSRRTGEESTSPHLLFSELTLVDVFLLDEKGKFARYQKTSSFLAGNDLSSYQEGVTVEGYADGFSTMRGVISETRKEHGFYLSRIDLGGAIVERKRITNTYVANLYGSFTKRHEHWTQELAFPTKHLVLHIHFPEKRPPKSVTCKTIKGLLEKPAPSTAKILDIFGRKSIVWEVDNPKVEEVLKLEWVW